MNETIAIVAESVLQEPITAGYIVISILLSSIVACTLVGNLFVIAAILIDKNLQTTANQLVLSLAVADLMVACLVMPLGAYNDINQGWWLGKGVCEFWTSADVLCCTASILNLLAIALDRYWAVTNVDYIYKRTRRRVSLMILCAWTVGAVVSLAPIFGWKDPDFARRVLDEHKCLVSQDVGYQIFATISTFYAPLVLLLALYWRIFQVARKRIRYKPGGRKSGQTIATGGRQATNLMIESGKSPDARGGQGNSGSSGKGKQSGSCSKQVAAGATTAAGVKSFAQVKGKVAAEQRASARAANVKSDCSGYCDGQTAHCDARHSENNARSVGQPGASAATELTAVNFVAAASAAAAAAAAPGPGAQQEFNLTSAPTLTNDKFRLTCVGAKAGDSDEFARLFVALESRLCQQRTPNERSDESSDQRDNGVARGAGRATEEKGGIVGKKGAKMNEREICLRRADGSGGNGDGRQATPGGCTTAGAQDAACDQRMVQDHFLRTGSGAHPTQSPDENDDDNKTNELAQAEVSGPNPTMIELGDKLTSVSGKRPGQPRDLEASEVGAPTDNDNEKNDDDDYRTADYNQPSSAYDRVRPRPSNNLCHAHQRSLLMVHEPGNRADVMNRQGSSGANNSSLAQLDVQLLASMTSDNLMRTTFGDCQHSAPTSSQVSECQACCCCGADDDGDRTQSEPEDDQKEDECGPGRNHRLRGACALPTSWHSDKRLACAGRMDDLGLLDKRLGVASGPASPPLPTKSSVDRIRELLASQGFKEPVPLRSGKSSRRQRRRGSGGRDQRSSSNNHWLGSASSPSSSASDFSPSESSTSSRSMLAAASTARLEPMQLIGADEFLEAQPAMQPISSPESATAAAVMTTLAGQADKLGDESKERHRDSNDNLGDKRAVRPLPGSPLRSPTRLISERSQLTRAMTTTARRAVTNNHKIDCHPQQQQHQDEPLSIATQANVRRANFLRSRPSMASARVAPVASLTGLTRGDGAGSLVSSSSRATLSIRSRFRALGQLVSFVQTSRQFNSTSSAGSESAPATSSQSGDDDEGDDDDDNNRQPHADDHSRADEISERANSGAGGNQVLGAERPEAQQQAASRTTTTTTDPGGLDRVVGKTSGDIERVNGALAVINSISLSGGVARGGAAAALSGAPSAYPHGKHRATTLSPGPDGPVSGATDNVVATAKQPRQSAAQQRRQNMEIKREKKAAKTLAIITGVFVCCWLPFFLNAIVMPICGPACTPSDLILSVLLWLGYLNSLLNPIIYTIFSPDFRRAFHRLLCWPDQARNGRAHKQRAGGGGGGCRARTSSDTPPVPPAAVHHHQHHGEHHEAGARHRVAAMA